MYETILVPTDGSEGTSDVMDHAVEMAYRYDARIHTLAVVDQRQYEQLQGKRRRDTKVALQENSELALENVLEHTEDEDMGVTTAVREGIPSQQIVAYASEKDVDVIAMGTHGRSNHERVVSMGSVTQRVVENTEVPVFVVHID